MGHHGLHINMLKNEIKFGTLCTFEVKEYGI